MRALWSRPGLPPPHVVAWAAAGLSLAVAAAGSHILGVAALAGNAALLLALGRALWKTERQVGRDAAATEIVSLAATPSFEPLQRAGASHPVSGLPMREALISRMSADRVGMLGAIWFSDFDRLTAFDAALGDRVFAAITERLCKMLPSERFVAQVDRGKLGLWFAATTEEAARAEIDAIGYALEEAIQIDGGQVVPDLKLRLSCFDMTAGAVPSTFLARALASFALPESTAAAASPMASYAELARERYELEQDLRQAIARRELALVYQPLVDASQGCVSGAEALIRWEHARLGPIAPTRFVPIMEAMGLANEIGLWALNTALREAKGWAGRGLGHLRVAVNVSGLQLDRDDLPVLVQRTLQRHELPASALEIELTESVATSDTEQCRRLFAQFRAMGVKLAVDDFGTGYSGFSSLRALAFDKIKIDREFVTDVDTRRDSQAICQSIVALGRGLGIRVLAEGVERPEELEWLRRHGCQHFQGYYFSAPLMPDAFATFAGDAAGLARLLSWRGTPAAIEERMRA